MRMFVLRSDGDPIGDASIEEIYGAIVELLRCGKRAIMWKCRPNGHGLIGLVVSVVGKEFGSFSGLGAGPVMKVDFETLEGRKGSITYIVPLRVLKGEFPDDLHEIIATVFTDPDEHVN